MSFELTPDQRAAVLANPGLPLHIHDLESQKVFLLIEQGAEPHLDAEFIHEGLRLAREEVSRGELGKRNIDEILIEARRRQSN
jgi:hypothetical protein